MLRLDPGQSNISAFNVEYNTLTEEAITNIPGTYVVRTRDGVDAKKTLDKMLKDKRVVFAELDWLTALDANPARIGAWGEPTSPLYLDQDATAMLGLQQAHAITRGGGNVIAVIDTGVQLDHPALAGSLMPGYDFVDDDAVPQDMRNGLDDNGNGRVDEVFGHGTHIAGVLHLVAPDAKIMPIRVLDADGTGTLIDLADAIAYAVRNGANIINISLGTSIETALLQNQIREASSMGVLIVASAGNLDSEVEQYPAADACVVSVTSIDARDARSTFSSFGKWVDFASPGEAIYSTFPPNGYAHWSGTSMATPFVAGQVALIRSVAPWWSLLDVVAVMNGTADKSIYKLKNNRDVKDRLGIGRIDIGASVQAAIAGQAYQTDKKKIKNGCIR
ncbi:MAG: S8 family serine peptidase [Anaerolineae bacterium]|nr:S8 family serine peptidase [Anaerolineae bacterium]